MAVGAQGINLDMAVHASAFLYCKLDIYSHISSREASASAFRREYEGVYETQSGLIQDCSS